MYKNIQKGFHKPKSKQILTSGIVVLCENITEDTTNPNQTIYNWLETRYTQIEYMGVLEHQVSEQIKQLEQLWDISEKYLHERYTF